MRIPLIGLFMVFALVSCSGPSTGRPPATRTAAVTDSYHGVEVTDPYRWLENGDDPEVIAWSNAQNAFTRSTLDRLDDRAVLRQRFEEIVAMMPVTYAAVEWRPELIFALRFDPPKNQPSLVVMPSEDDPESARVLLDPDVVDPTGKTTIDWYVPSPDGNLVAVCLSTGGTESGDVHFIDTRSGNQVDVVLERVNGGTAGGDLAWTGDGSGVFYTRYPTPAERPPEDANFFQTLWFHALGSTAGDDRFELGEGFPRVAEIEVEHDPWSPRILATVQFGDSGKFAHYLRSGPGEWRQISSFDDGIIEILFGPEGHLFAVSRHGAPRGKVLRLDADDQPWTTAHEIVPEGDDSIVTDFYNARPTIVTGHRLYLIYQTGGPSELRVFDHDGRPLPRPEILPVSQIGSRMAPLAGDDVLYANNSFVEPTAWYRYRAADGASTKTALATEYPIDFDDVEVVRDTVTSADGTEVPINIIRSKGLELDGSNPTLLTGYGGFGVSRSPRFNALRRVWFDHGGVFAVANLRGGGEYGEDWHRAGMLTAKQNVFDDFAACMRYLVDQGYTTPDKLVIEGGSNGGLLMGAMITQHPDAARTVVSHVGIYDMLRVELSSNGRFNIPEYGTVEDPDQFAALFAYSPYHHVTDGTSYPAVLFLTGANDPRVDPMHSRKMTARLQAATSSGLPVLLRTSADSGHGGGTPLDEQINQLVDVESFIYDRLGITATPSGGS